MTAKRDWTCYLSKSIELMDFQLSEAGSTLSRHLLFLTMDPCKDYRICIYTGHEICFCVYVHIARSRSISLCAVLHRYLVGIECNLYHFSFGSTSSPSSASSSSRVARSIESAGVPKVPKVLLVIALSTSW